MRRRTNERRRHSCGFVPHPLPPYEGNPWSHWGKGVLAHGRYYTAIGDHRGEDGNAYLYEYDPESRTLRAVGDVLSAHGAHESGDWGYGRVHGRISEGPCGLLYFATYWGSQRNLSYGGSYTGDLLLRYNPFSRNLEALGVPMPEMGTPSTQLWRAGGLFYGEANHPFGNGSPFPSGKKFWAYDLARGEVVFQSPNYLDQEAGREIAVDADGRAYYQGSDFALMRYDPATGTEEPIGNFVEGGTFRAATDPASDGTMFFATRGPDHGTRGPHHAYLFDPAAEQLTVLGELDADPGDMVTSWTGEVAYFVPGASGAARAANFPLQEIDRSGNIRTVLELGPFVARAGGPFPAGSYSLNIDPDTLGDLYILANAGPTGTDETFGQPLLMVVHLPESELR